MKASFGWKTGWLWGVLTLTCFAIVTSGQTPLPDGPGKQLVQEVCGSSCHGSESWSELRLSKEDWDPLVRDMSSRGEARSDAEINQITDYLAKNFGPEKEAAENAPKPATAESKASEKINVNKATAKELETSLALSSKDAEAIVSYREKNGNFKDFDELKKVPDIDIKKLDEKKDKLTY